VAYAEHFHEESFIQWRVVDNCIWCALFVTTQFDVIFIFPNQRFDEVCRYNRHILLHALPLFYVIALNINYERSKLEYRRKIHSTPRHSNSQLQKYQVMC